MNKKPISLKDLPIDFDIYCLCTKCFLCMKAAKNEFGENCPKFEAKKQYMREYDIEMLSNGRIKIFKVE